YPDHECALHSASSSGLRRGVCEGGRSVHSGLGRRKYIRGGNYCEVCERLGRDPTTIGRLARFAMRRRAGASAPAGESTRRLKPALYGETKNALTQKMYGNSRRRRLPSARSGGVR